MAQHRPRRATGQQRVKGSSVSNGAAYEVHPLAELIPAMSDAEFQELRDDIEANGLRQSITLYEGKVLDGRHRARACEELGIEPETTNYTGDSPATYVWSLNGVRRNLDASQRSMVAAKMLGPLEEENRKRMVEGGRRGGKGSGQKANPLPSEVPKADSQQSREQAAVLVGASPRSVGRAKRVLDADPELAEEVAAGEVKVTAAERKVRESSNGDLATKPDKAGRQQPATYFGKGDKWKESTEPLTRYLAAWGKRDYEFAHVNPAEARKRVKRIDDLMAGLEAARADLEPRTQKAKLTL